MKLDKLLDQMQQQLAQKNATADCKETSKLASAKADGKEANSAVKLPPHKFSINTNAGHHPPNVITAFLKDNPLSTFQMSSSMTAAVKSSATTPKKPTSSANVIPNNASPPQTSSTTPTVVPLSQDVASQGLLAVGGCRQCSKTFTDRLSLIHHFVDHFPNIFYSFEESQSPTRPQQFSGKAPPTSTPEPGNGKHNNNIAGFGQQIRGGGGIAPDAGTSPAEGELLGHLADLFGMVGGPLNSGRANPMGPAAAMEQMLGTNFMQQMMNGRVNSQQQQIYVGNGNGQQMSNKPSNFATRSAPSQQSNGSAKGGKKRQTTTAIAQQSHQDHQQQQPVPAKKSTPDGRATGMPALSELPYHMCPHCCLTFAETNAFKAHMAVHESELMNQQALPVSMHLLGAAAFAVMDQLKCPLCDMKFSSPFRLNEHMRLHSAHACDICQKTFMTAFDLNLHTGTHTGHTYDCKDCGKCFPCRKTLAEHNRSHRMLLSQGAPEPPPSMVGMKSPKIEPVEAKQTSDGENTPLASADLLSDGGRRSTESGGGDQQMAADQQMMGRDRRKMRMPRRGEKSRRNATLVALESTSPPAGGGGVPAAAVTPIDFWTAAASAASKEGNNNPNALLTASAADCGGGGGLAALGSWMGQLLQQQQQQSQEKSD